MNNKINMIAASVLTLIIASASFYALMQLSPNEAVDRETLFQVASFKSLSDGGYDGFVSYAELAKWGDFGIGTFDGLDGEMVALDGIFYQIPADGIPRTASLSDLAPYATVTFFDADQTFTVSGLNYTDLKAFLDGALLNKEAIYAIKVVGTFEYAQTRSPQKQTQPYPPIADALKDQSVFNFTDVSATAVGFWFPTSMDGVDYAGYHLHLITEDRSAGGHLLECIIKDARVEVDQTNKFTLVLP